MFSHNSEFVKKDTETAAIRELSRKHVRKHLDELFDGSLPVFVAAAVARAISAILAAIIGEGLVSVQIGVTFCYALCIAHLIGYLYAYNRSSSARHFHYFFHLFTENVGFAWKQTISLMILLFINAGNETGLAFTIWLTIVFVIVIFVLSSNMIQFHVLKPSHHVNEHLLCFVSEAFALPIAYGFNVVVASLFYVNASSSYLSSVDDKDPSVGDANPHLSDLFIIYAVGITFLLALAQYSLDNCCKSCLSIKPDPTRVTSVIGDDIYNINMAGQSTLPSTSCSDWINPEDSTTQTLLHLFKTTCGYVVGCAWYTWSVLAFQKYFDWLPYGGILGLFVYAVAITLLFANYLARQSAGVEFRLSEIGAGFELPAKSGAGGGHDIGRESLFGDADDDDASVKARRKELLLSAARLVVGWSWEEFVISCFTFALPRARLNNADLWVAAAIKTVVAALIVVFGIRLEQYMRHRREGGGSEEFGIGSSSDDYSGVVSSGGRFNRQGSIDRYMLGFVLYYRWTKR